MSEERSRLTVWGFLKGLMKIVVGFSLLVQSFLFIIVLVMIISVLAAVSGGLSGNNGSAADITVPNGGALVLNPQGTLVEVSPPVDPFEEAISSAFGQQSQALVSVHDLVRVIRAAQDDDRIKVLVLDLQGLYIPAIYASKAYYVSDAIAEFRASGKKVIAIGDSYNQEQYLIASGADKILMHDFGQVMITGYGSYRSFYKSALEKLSVTSNVFRVGTFKSAIEPYIRDDMSPAAKEANRAFLGVLWDHYTASVEGNRAMAPGSIAAMIDNLDAETTAANGNAGIMAVNTGLVDELLDRDGQVQYIVGLVGRPDDETEYGFKGIGYVKYKLSIPSVVDREDVGNIAVITAAGTILDGEQPAGVVGGDTVARAIREARGDDDIKAIVLRVDSPGGSAFASEVIRDELLRVKSDGKPLVVSMGSLAASGGYWISANADEIWAAPTTVTGSIGVFGFIPTFERTLEKVGVYSDGVGTTPLSSIGNIGPGAIPDELASMIQASVEDIYRRFIGLVAEGRGLTTVRVDEIGQGRVWIGEAALGLNLVDNLGDIDDAIAAAAKRAGLDDYDVVGTDDNKSPMELFLENIANAEAKAFLDANVSDQLFGGVSTKPLDVRRLLEFAEKEAAFYSSFNDPNSVYVRCEACPMP